jgi:hypothetical protein
MWGSHGENTHGSGSTSTKISKAVAMQRDWETRLAGEPEYNSRMKKCAEISKEATPEVTKEEPIPEKLEEHIKSRTTLSIDFPVLNETNKRACQV